MASIVFKNIVANPNATTPSALNLSLASNGVTLQTIGSNAKALAFNAIAPLDASTQNYSVTANGVKTTFAADDVYIGSVFALILKDGSSFTFTLNDSNPDSQTLSNNGYDTVTSEKLRLWNLNG